jgi:hypothetical protein
MHRLAHSRVDCGRRPPDHAGRCCAADIDHIEHPRIYSQHFAGAGGVEHAGIGKRHSDQKAVKVLFFEAGVVERFSRQLRHQLEWCHVRRRFFPRLEFSDPNRGCLTLKTHPA